MLLEPRQPFPGPCTPRDPSPARSPRAPWLEIQKAFLRAASVSVAFATYSSTVSRLRRCQQGGRRPAGEASGDLFLRLASQHQLLNSNIASFSSSRGPSDFLLCPLHLSLYVRAWGKPFMTRDSPTPTGPPLHNILCSRPT